MLKLENIAKTYRTTEVQTQALNAINLEIRPDEFVAIMGPSGCGKSTLLNMLGLVDQPTSGNYWFCGENVAGYSEDQLTAVRRKIGVGFIFQSFNLIDDLTVAENVEVALIYRKIPAGERGKRVTKVLEHVGLAHRAKHMPQQLSGGQQQRVAFARALVCAPKLILADEPTGNLDTANGEAVMQMLERCVGNGTTVVMVTHSEAFAARAHRCIHLLDGRIVDPMAAAA
jgi:putative ABC transport system ATP-binding protein